jgi:hypothetical protein
VANDFAIASASANRNEALLSRWPHLVVLEPDRALVHSQHTSELEQGKGCHRGRFNAYVERQAPTRRVRGPFFGP